MFARILLTTTPFNIPLIYQLTSLLVEPVETFPFQRHGIYGYLYTLVDSGVGTDQLSTTNFRATHYSSLADVSLTKTWMCCHLQLWFLWHRTSDKGYFGKWKMVKQCPSANKERALFLLIIDHAESIAGNTDLLWISYAFELIWRINNATFFHFHTLTFLSSV